MQTLHRARERLIGERTALINQLRAILMERGVTVAQGRRKLEQHLAAMLDAGAETRGNKYLRKLLIHGARSVLPVLAARSTPLGSWLQELLKRMHKNAAVVALANKLARIAWAVLRRGAAFDSADASSAAA